MTLPLQGVRVLDFGWVNAGAKGGARYLSTYGAEVVHLEWKGRLDILRTTSPPPPRSRRCRAREYQPRLQLQQQPRRQVGHIPQHAPTPRAKTSSGGSSPSPTW